MQGLDSIQYVTSTIKTATNTGQKNALNGFLKLLLNNHMGQAKHAALLVG